MYTFKTFLFLTTVTTLCVVKSEVDQETMCKNDYRDEKNNKIDVLEYCSNKLCLEKCCDLNMMVSLKGNKCVETKKFMENKKRFPDFEAQYKSINILSSSKVNKSPKKNFVFVKNFGNIDYLPNCTAERVDIDNYDITEDGSLLWCDYENITGKLDKLNYCIDYTVKAYVNGTAGVNVVIKQYILITENLQRVKKFENVGVLISSLFLLLVLVVYCLLPDLRNLTGLVLMAYTLSLLVAFITKLVLTFNLAHLEGDDKEFCKHLTPILYFAFVSSFCWLSVYAFDVWWGLRCFRIKRKSKHGELVKFMWYCLYAWGGALLLTAVIVTLDNYPDSMKLEPFFEDCFRPGQSFNYYYKIPIGILIFVNIVLFCMTVYNIWMVKRAVHKCHDSRSSKQQNSKFATYAKLCLMMGVTWCAELLPPEQDLWIYILTNSLNLLTGLSIFYLFVWKKTILLQLCKKFNIRNNYIENLELELVRKRNKSGITRSTVLTSTIKSWSNGQPQEMDLLQNCPKGENIS